MACPVCDKPETKAYRPFCSKRCADVDLGRWMNDSYVLPGPPADEVDIKDDVSDEALKH